MLDSAPIKAINAPELNYELNALLPRTVKELSKILRSTLAKSCCLDPLPSELVVNNRSDDYSEVPAYMKEAVLKPLLKKPSL